MKKFTYTINGIKYNVEVQSIEDNIAEIEVNGTTYKVEMEPQEGKPAAPKIKKPAAPAAPISRPATAPVAAAPVATPPAASSGGGHEIKSPLPGVILDITVKVGDEVKRGDKLVVLEAMKMENDIKSDKDGKVISISVQKNDNVQEGATLVTIG